MCRLIFFWSNLYHIEPHPKTSFQRDMAANNATCESTFISDSGAHYNFLSMHGPICFFWAWKRTYLDLFPRIFLYMKTNLLEFVLMYRNIRDYDLRHSDPDTFFMQSPSYPTYVDKWFSCPIAEMDYGTHGRRAGSRHGNHAPFPFAPMFQNTCKHPSYSSLAEVSGVALGNIAPALYFPTLRKYPYAG